MADREAHLDSLQPRFMAALALREKGKVDEAIDLLRGVLRDEPRLAEPRMELARIHLDTGRLEEAEIEAREAIRLLESGGQWTDDLPENVVQAIAWATLGEILKERAATDEVVFGPEETFRELLEQSRAAFARAHALDPSDAASEVSAAELEDSPRRPPELTGDFAADAIPDDDDDA